MITLVAVVLLVSACRTSNPPVPGEPLLNLIPLGGGWSFDKLETLRLSDGPPLAVGFASRPLYERQVCSAGCNREGVAVAYRYQELDKKPDWVLVWHSQPILYYYPPEVAPDRDKGPVYFHSLVGREKALFVVSIHQVGASTSIAKVVSFEIGKNGSGRVVTELEIQHPLLKQEGGSLLIEGSLPAGVHRFEVSNGEPRYVHIRPSQLPPPPGARVLRFVATRKGIVASESSVVQIKVGETVVLVPEPGVTAELWDAGRIKAYSDAWNGPPIRLARAYQMHSPEYTFKSTGEFHIALVLADNVTTNVESPEPTFTVLVRP